MYPAQGGSYMKNYQLELRQIVDYPRCRIYREFIQTLIADRSIRTGGCSGLFYYVVLCAYANFRTSYRRIDGISYTVYPGEWICSITDITEWFRVRFHYQAFAILKSLQDRQLITFTRLGRGHIVKFSITDWRRNNTALDYNCPCQKDSGFFFIPVSTATELISAGRASEMDVILDLWISAIYKDQQVRGSEIGPVAYFRNGTGNPLVNYSELSARWGISRSSVGRLLKKLADFDYLSLLTFPGRSGTVIYLKNYLSTMFQISDVMIDKEEVAMCLNLRVSVPDTISPESGSIFDEQICVSTELPSVSKPHMLYFVRKVLRTLEAQGISCLSCPKSKYMLYPLSDDCTVGIEKGTISAGLAICCGAGSPLYRFEMTIIQMLKRKECATMSGKMYEKRPEEDARYHDTWRLLKKYRDVTWSLELSIRQVKNQFRIDYDCSIEDFLESIYMAGADLGGTDIENHARCIERSYKMLTLLENSVNLLRTHHQSGEVYYWILYYSFLSPQKLKNVEEIIEALHPHIRTLASAPTTACAKLPWKR